LKQKRNANTPCREVSSDVKNPLVPLNPAEGQKSKNRLFHYSLIEGSSEQLNFQFVFNHLKYYFIVTRDIIDYDKRLIYGLVNYKSSRVSKF
jgi:hypothetical protein